MAKKEAVVENVVELIEKPIEVIIEVQSLDGEVNFNSWYADVQKLIPEGHKKEILWADFKARGLKEKDLKKNFDNALEKYGIKLKR